MSGSNAIASQIDVHALYGGVVPEIASRMHVEALDPLLDVALQEAGLTLEAIDAVAVTHGARAGRRAADGRELGEGAGVRGGQAAGGG